VLSCDRLKVTLLACDIEALLTEMNCCESAVDTVCFVNARRRCILTKPSVVSHFCDFDFYSVSKYLLENCDPRIE